jgi:hypothetical protein
MAKKKLGKKYACYECGCKFYDLGKPKPICPKCGADQKKAPQKEVPSAPKAGVASASSPRSRGRRRRDEESSMGGAEPYQEQDVESGAALEDGLSLIDDEELIGAGGEDYAEDD